MSTNSFKLIARNNLMTVAEVRAIAADLGLNYDYDANRRTWYLNEDVRTTIAFNRHVTDMKGN